jgi:CheY-like chemotaxis protein
MTKLDKQKKSGKLYRILVIEDGSADQVALRQLGQEESTPYDYAFAGSISEAKKILKSQKFDIII